MTEDSQRKTTLPVRGRPSRPGGRHRRPVSGDLPPDAPILLLTTYGSAHDTDRASDDIAGLVRSAHPEVDVRLGVIGGAEPSLEGVLQELAGRRTAVIVPLLTGPHPAMYRHITEAIAATGASAVLSEPLGPHPLLAEALHVRLAERGLARADRIRLIGLPASIDGVIVATVGGAEAARDADATAVLLAARLALPVVSASLDGAPGIADSAARLRAAGARNLALAPCVIGPEADPRALAAAAEEIDAGCAAPIGAHHGVIRIIAMRYDIALDEALSQHH